MTKKKASFNLTKEEVALAGQYPKVRQQFEKTLTLATALRSHILEEKRLKANLEIQRKSTAEVAMKFETEMQALYDTLTTQAEYTRPKALGRMPGDVKEYREEPCEGPAN